MRMQSSTYLFAAASLLPAALIVTASGLAGAWIWVAFLSMTVLVAVMDRANLSVDAQTGLRTALPCAIAFAHFSALTATLVALGGNSALNAGEKVLLVITMGLYAGQVSNACAHELIHRNQRPLRALGIAIYISLLNGQHVSAHLLVHHVHAGTARDPNSAPLGRDFYRFAACAAVAEFMDGWRAETKRRARHATGFHPFTYYLCGAAVSLLGAFLLSGLWAVAGLLALSLHSQMQLMLSDYVQHYGLQRQITQDGKPEPMAARHCWNAPQTYSGAMMLLAPRHSDHHKNPARAFPDLELSPDTMPTLPFNLPLMGAIALVPPFWRRIMDPKVHQWSAPQTVVSAPSSPCPSPLPSQ